MSNTSASGGYLSPDPNVTPPLEDDALVDFLQDVVVQLTGLNKDTAVRPRWQEEPPDLPARSFNWAAIGVQQQQPDSYAYVELQPDESFETQRHETVEVLLSFYGPNGAGLASRFADGLQLQQNLDALRAAGIGQMDTGAIVNSPEMIKNAWYQRKDITWRMRHIVMRNYPVLALLSASGTVYNEHYSTPFTVEEPTP